MYQPFTIVDGTGNFSILNGTPTNLTPTHSGSVTCLSGTCYVRLLKTRTVDASGVNASMANLPTGATFTDGWSRLLTGGELSFGMERVLGATQSDTEPVGQIDIVCDDTATVTCLQH